jgi:hypothetical protein
MLHIVWNETECKRAWSEGRHDFTTYFFEMMDYIGLSYEKWDHKQWLLQRPSGLTIVIGSTESEQWARGCIDYCEQGNGLLAVGNMYGLQDLLGVTTLEPVNEGWIRWDDAPLAQGLQSSFHFFEAIGMKVSAADVQAWGVTVQRNGLTRPDPAFTIRKVGKGYAALLTVNLMKTFYMIQHGVPVYRDGYPAPDGSAPLDEGFLKADDACVLDWQQDRNHLAQGEVPFYLHPVVDEWRILWIRVLHMLAGKLQFNLAQTWFWPDGLDGIGLISHDTDLNSEPHARSMLQRLKDAGINSTWCIIMPGYEEEVNRQIVMEGHEVALHYNAMGTDIPQSGWSEQHFNAQLAMLKEQFPDQEIVSNKNHYLRWEGDVQFYQWCERAGIGVDQSRGGTKRGNKGFLAGTCHPYLPVSATEQNRLLSTLSVPTLAWDPPMENRCTAEEARALLERSIAVNGIGHFLFHPAAGIEDEDRVGRMLVELVHYGVQRGIAWWTSKQIGQWFHLRRQVRIKGLNKREGVLEVIIESGSPVRSLAILLADVTDKVKLHPAANDASLIGLRQVERFGCRYLEVNLDIKEGKSILFLEDTDTV